MRKNLTLKETRTMIFDVRNFPVLVLLKVFMKRKFERRFFVLYA